MQLKLNILQMLRGFAAIGVLLFHIGVSTTFYFNVVWLNDCFSSFWVGVDFFFVLSGFIMVYVHYTDLKNRSNVKVFFLKRFVRIYPIYWIIASIYLVLQLYVGKLTFEKDWLYIVKSYLLIPQSKYPFLFPAWSLVFECFFYVIFGLGLLLGLRLAKYTLFVWLILILLNDFTRYSTLFVLDPRILEFLIGCVIGYIFQKYIDQIKRYCIPIFYCSISIFAILIICFIFLKLPVRGSVSGSFFYGSLAALLIFGTASLESNKPVKLPSLLLLIGSASYVFYLSHQIIVGLVYKVSSGLFHHQAKPAILFFTAIFTLIFTLIFSVLLHKSVENPLLKKLQGQLIKKND